LVDFDRSAHIDFEDHEKMKMHLKNSLKSSSFGDIELFSHPQNLYQQFTPYVPPELIYRDLLTSEPLLRTVEASRNGRPYDSVLRGSSTYPASYAIDMWSVGVLLYRLCTNTDLFHTDKEGSLIDNEDHEQLFILSEWADDVKWKKLSRVENQLARNLLWRLLHKDPSRRPTAKEAMQHPFVAMSLPRPSITSLTKVDEDKSALADGADMAENEVIIRTTVDVQQRETAEHVGLYTPPTAILYDVFLSCGCDVDAVHAKVVYDMLISKGLRVFWHRARFCNTLHNSTSVTATEEDDYCNNLSKCHVFVPLLSFRVLDCFSYDVLHVGGKVTRQQQSEKVVDLSDAAPFVPTPKEIPWDNFLFGLRYGFELKELGILEKICPVIIGEKTETAVLYESGSNNGPTPGSRYLSSFLTISEDIETKVQICLDRESLGPAVRRNVNQVDMIQMLLKDCVGVLLRGKIENGYKRVVEGVCQCLSPEVFAKQKREAAAAGGGGSAGVRATIGALEERLREQDIVIETHEVKLEKQAAELLHKSEEIERILATQNEDFKEFNRMKEALTQAKLRILDLKLGGGGRKKGRSGEENDDDPDESASNDSDYETDSNYANSNSEEAEDHDQNQKTPPVVPTGVLDGGSVVLSNGAVSEDNGNDSAAVIESWLSGLDKK
jgi:hypothetical protein